MPPRCRNNIVVVKLAAPRKVNLPGGRTFQPKYRRVTKNESTSNVTIKRRCKKEEEDNSKEKE